MLLLLGANRLARQQKSLAPIVIKYSYSSMHEERRKDFLLQCKNVLYLANVKSFRAFYLFSENICMTRERLHRLSKII
jgi:hypothetical protein